MHARQPQGHGRNAEEWHPRQQQVQKQDLECAYAIYDIVSTMNTGKNGRNEDKDI